jgi:cyclopropane fatty-acyl-phospholipid synthase-like methyltransferase
MAQAERPTGFFGKILAKGMAWGHRSFYENTARVLDLKEDDRCLEIGFGSGFLLRNMLLMFQELLDWIILRIW